MTDCFIMIHVIIFFVGVTEMLSGNRGVWLGRRQHRGCRCWYPKKCSVQRGGNLCSVGVCGVGVCVLNHCVKFPLVWGGILLSVWSGAAEPDPAAKPVTASLPQQKQLRNWAIIHIQVPAICKYRAWGVHSTFLH